MFLTHLSHRPVVACVLSLGVALSGLWPVVAQADRGARHHSPRAEAPRQHSRHAPAPRAGVRHPQRDSRPHYAPPRAYAPRPHFPAQTYRHSHFYRSLPHAAVLLTLGGLAYYYHSGLFYRPLDTGYTVVNAPLGAVITSLPPGYRTVLQNGQIYYVAGNTYFLQHPQGYVVTSQPNSFDLNTPSALGEVYSYPASGQGPEQQARDRYECHRWGVEQSGFDPSLGNPGAIGAHDNYSRAVGACLGGRGYVTR